VAEPKNSGAEGPRLAQLGPGVKIYAGREGTLSTVLTTNGISFEVYFVLSPASFTDSPVGHRVRRNERYTEIYEARERGTLRV